jgi:hypothetical protein
MRAPRTTAETLSLLKQHDPLRLYDSLAGTWQQAELLCILRRVCAWVEGSDPQVKESESPSIP